MKLIICGSRTFADHELFHQAIATWIERHGMPSEIVSGDAPGADRMAGDWAAREGIRCSAFPANWKLHGRSAGPRRNREMLDALLGSGYQGYVLALPGGRGTSDCCRQAEAAGVPVVYANGREG